MAKFLSNKSLIKKLSFGLAGLLSVSLISLLIAIYQAPAIVIYFAKDWYSQQGQDYQLSVAQWQFKPWQTSLELKNLELLHPTVGAGKTELASLQLDFSLKDLFSNRVLVRKLSLANSDLDLALIAKETGNSLAVAGLVLDLPVENQTARADLSEQKELAWQVNLLDLQLENIALHWNLAVGNQAIEKQALGLVENSENLQPDLVSQGKLLIKNLHLTEFALDDLASPKLELAMSLEKFGLRFSQLQQNLEQVEEAGESASTQLVNINLALQNPLQIDAQGKLTELATRSGYSGNLQLTDFNLDADLPDLVGVKLGFWKLVVNKLQLNQQQQSFADLNLESLGLSAEALDDLQLNLAKLQLKNLGYLAEKLTADQLRLQDLQLVQNELATEFDSLELSQISYKDQQAKVKDLELAQLRFSQPGLVVELDKFSAEEISYQEEITKIDQVNLTELKFEQAEIQAGFNSLLAKNLAYTNDQLRLNELFLQQIFFQQNELAIKLKNLQANQLGYQEEQTAIASAILEELKLTQPDLVVDLAKLQLSKLEAGEDIYRLQEIAGTGLVSEQPDLKAKLASFSGKGFNYYNLAETLDWQELGLKDLNLRVKDTKVKPALWLRVELENLLAGKAKLNLDPNNFSLTEQMPLQAKAKINQHANADLNAKFSLFTNQASQKIYPEGKFDLQVKGLNLVSFNGYLVEQFGYQLERGTLDIDADIQVVEQQLGGEIDFLLRNSKFVPADKEVIDRISKQITMPLDTAIGLLRDKNGNLRLNVPVEGDIQDPNFKLTDVFRQLRNKALRQGSIFMLKQSLQPFTTMITVATFAGKYAMAIRLDALDFAENSFELTDLHQQNLAKIAELLRNKNKMEVSACPFVSEQEIAQMPDPSRWERLARQRGSQVKNWFEQQAPDVAHRVTICMPQQGKEPQVMLGIQ